MRLCGCMQGVTIRLCGGMQEGGDEVVWWHAEYHYSNICHYTALHSQAFRSGLRTLGLGLPALMHTHTHQHSLCHT